MRILWDPFILNGVGAVNKTEGGNKNKVGFNQGSRKPLKCELNMK